MSSEGSGTKPLKTCWLSARPGHRARRHGACGSLHSRRSARPGRRPEGRPMTTKTRSQRRSRAHFFLAWLAIGLARGAAGCGGTVEPGTACDTEGEKNPCTASGSRQGSQSCQRCVQADPAFCPAGAKSGDLFWTQCDAGCVQNGSSCAKGESCCGYCVQGQCTGVEANCKDDGVCANGSECCSGLCDSTHRCRKGSCGGNNLCTLTAECCEGGPVCGVDGVCRNTCIAKDDPCTADVQCCSLHCGANGTCATP